MFDDDDTNLERKIRCCRYCCVILAKEHFFGSLIFLRKFKMHHQNNQLTKLIEKTYIPSHTIFLGLSITQGCFCCLFVSVLDLHFVITTDTRTFPRTYHTINLKNRYYCKRSTHSIEACEALKQKQCTNFDIVMDHTCIELGTWTCIY